MWFLLHGSTAWMVKQKHFPVTWLYGSQYIQQRIWISACVLFRPPWFIFTPLQLREYGNLKGVILVTGRNSEYLFHFFGTSQISQRTSDYNPKLLVQEVPKNQICSASLSQNWMIGFVTKHNWNCIVCVLCKHGSPFGKRYSTSVNLMKGQSGHFHGNHPCPCMPIV